MITLNCSTLPIINSIIHQASYPLVLSLLQTNKYIRKQAIYRRKLCFKIEINTLMKGVSPWVQIWARNVKIPSLTVLDYKSRLWLENRPITLMSAYPTTIVRKEISSWINIVSNYIGPCDLKQNLRILYNKLVEDEFTMILTATQVSKYLEDLVTIIRLGEVAQIYRYTVK